MLFQEFSKYYLANAKYELIDGGKTFYGEIPQLKGVWAEGPTLEKCRQNLLETMEGWLILRLKKNLPIPKFSVPFKRLPASRSYVQT